MFWIAVIVILTTFLYLYLKSINNYWIHRGVKQGKPWILFGDNAGFLFKKYSFPELIEKIYNDCPGTR